MGNGGLIKDLDKNIPIRISMCDTDGIFLKVDDFFNLIFKVDEIKCVGDIDEINTLFNSDNDNLIFTIEEGVKNNYFRLDKNIIDGYIVFVLSDITHIYSKYNDFTISEYSNDNSILPIMWVKECGDIVYSNKSLSDLVDFGQLINTKVYRLASDIKKKDWVDLWKDLKKNKTKEFVHRFYNKKEDKIHILNIVANMVKYYDWEYCYIIISDITELVDSNIRLQREKEKAMESERLKDIFLLNMSHEIRTPMNAIVGFTEILHENIDSTLKEYTNIINQNVDYLLSIIDNIITITKIDSNQIKIKYDHFDVLEMLDDIRFSYNLKLKKGKKDLYIILDNNENCVIKSDKFIIEESLNRLVDNSIKFTKDGYIHIGYIIKGDDIVFYVKDSGIGIDNKFQEIIFDRFRQIDKHSMGSGLGLAIFSAYVNILGGKYDVDSDLYSGTIMSFSINIDGNNDIEKIDVSSMDYLKLNGKRIMVVEDMDVNQIMLYDMLTPYKVSIIKAVDGRECIEKFDEIKDIDLILMDLDIPFIDGYEATQIIRQKDKAIPIIAQTAYAHKENRERAKKIGIDDFITKPINKENLIRVIIKNLK